jgi:hypothetical protein
MDEDPLRFGKALSRPVFGTGSIWLRPGLSCHEPWVM